MNFLNFFTFLYNIIFISIISNATNKILTIFNWRKALASNKNWVNGFNLAPASLYTPSNFGITYNKINVITPMENTEIIDGYIKALTIAFLVFSTSV